MKKTFTLLCLACFFFATHAQIADTIPNAGFENWVNIGGWYNNPAGWGTNNAQLTTTEVLRSDSANTGNYAMEMTNAGGISHPLAWCNFRIPHHPVTLEGFFRGWLTIPPPGIIDSATISVKIFYYGQLRDSGTLLFSGGFYPGYNSFSISISQSFPLADSVEIKITGGLRTYSDFILDDLSFSFSEAVTDHTHQTPFLVSPNPANQYLNIPASTVTHSICNLLGQKMYSANPENSPSPKSQIDVSAFPNGIYFLRAQSANEISEEKFVVQH